MPISWLDVILIIIMLISGFLAMVRGFTREVLSIFSCGLVLDSQVGALDRTLGFVFGLARGFLLVAIVFILFSALARDQPEWVRNARSYSILQQTQVAIESLLPMNPEQFLPGPKEEEQPGGQPEGRSEEE